MKKERWEKINEIVFEALQLKSEKRQDFIDKECVGSADLLKEVESLLFQEKKADEYFDSPALDRYSNLVDDEDSKPSRINETIENYRILQEIGFGGMGSVYLAERIDKSFEQRVALKVIKTNVFDPEREKRFVREQSILASLNHPNIAKLFDAGIGENGEPFLAMEYVDGLDISSFVKENNCSIKDRIKVFLKVCSAVSYAHRNLVIHRDIKPSNILVTADGEPMLLDFGIAKILEEEDGPDENKTQTRFLALTPAYASPEQVRNEKVSITSDVYSLGVVLYELVSGKVPFNSEINDLAAIIKTISERTPEKPSENMFRADHDAKQLDSKLIRGDLDVIILKALRKDPERRYQTAGELADDLKRHLAGRPIEARPATLSYRAKKFYRRNSIAVLAGFLILASLVTGTIVSVWQASVAREQTAIAKAVQNLAESEAKKAKIEEEKAKKIAKFMGKIISYANPASYAEGARTNGEAKVIDVILEMSDKIESEFADQIDIQAELHHKFAEVILQVSNAQQSQEKRQEFGSKALSHANRALKLRKQFYGERHELIAKDMYYLWAVTGDTSNARLLSEAIQMMRETNSENLNLAYMLVSYADRLQHKFSGDDNRIYKEGLIPPSQESKYQIAERYYLEALKIFPIYYEETQYSIIRTKCYLAYSLIMQSKITQADKYEKDCRQSAKTLEFPFEVEGVKVLSVLLDEARKEKGLSLIR